jgi:FkbM family methyltransferase
MKLVVGDCVSDPIAFTGIYELAFTRVLTGLACDPGGVLVDVGANLGYFSLLWAAQKPENRVVAFEASPRNVSLLTHNIETNHVSDRVEVRAEAAGPECGAAQFDVGPEEQTGWGGIVHEATSSTVEVPMRRLDAALANEARIAVLKIDVEGADALVLEGAEQLLREKRIAHIFFECNKPRMARLGIPENRPIELLRDCGYMVQTLSTVTDGSEFHATPAAGATT